MFFNSKKLIGIDLGSNSIKAIELDLNRQGASLASFAIAPTPKGAIYGGDIQDAALLSTSISQLLQQMKTKRTHVAMALWGAGVIVKKIQIPKVDKKLLSEQIRFEAEQYIPFDLNNVTIAHHELGLSKDLSSLEILLVAAQNQVVQQQGQIIEALGLKCSILDVSGFALANAFEFSYGKTQDIIALVNFGAAVTNIVVVSQGNVIFCRDIMSGGDLYTNEIHKSLGIAFEEAESLKLSASARKEVPDEVHSLISQVNQSLVEEIRSSLDFFSATSGDTSIQRFYYTGGASLTPGLVNTAIQNLGMTFEPFNPFVKLKVNSKKFPESYLEQIHFLAPVCLGLGLRKVGDA